MYRGTTEHDLEDYDCPKAERLGTKLGERRENVAEAAGELKCSSTYLCPPLTVNRYIIFTNKAKDIFLES